MDHKAETTRGAVTDICTSVKISRDMFYRWWNRYQTLGWSGLTEKPKGRPLGPEIDKTIKKQVLKLRERYKWGPKKNRWFTTTQRL